MASPMVDFCEQTNPGVLSEARPIRCFGNADRIHNSLTSNPEKRALVWMAERTPRRITSDHLTLLGFIAQVMAGVSYALARWDRYWLVAGIFFLALNWLGDSLDGTVARVRRQQRPRYGFYVDHIIDSFGGLALMAGLALSGYMHPYIAIALLVGFLLLSIQSYLATYTLGEFQLSFWSFGPTELRVLLSIGNVALLYHPMVFHGRYRLFDVGGSVGIAGMTAMLIFFTIRNTSRLYAEERIR
ncbi:MAG: CDP-alcohol phosphatidyltransferase family protein [Terriglobales bacterium]